MNFSLDKPMTSSDEVDFVHTGPGTLAGAYWRRYWHPVYVKDRLKPASAVPIQILGENFTLYRGESGAPHVVDFRCAHRGTQLSVGWVEGECIRCMYHGWKYEASGQCVEQPAEDAGFAEKVRIRSCPTKEYLGLIFAYLGAGDAPPFPTYPQLEEEGVLNVSSYVRKCNCFSTLENGVDNVHLAFTHARSNFTNHGLNWDIPKITAEETEYGVAMYATRRDGKVRVNHYVMPSLLYIKGSPEQEGGWRDSFGWRVPIDDSSHASFNLSLVRVTGEAAQRYQAAQTGRRTTRPGLPSAREVADDVLAGKLSLQEVEERPDLVNIQDHVAQEGQGAIPDRNSERLGRSDTAIILLRKIWIRELRSLADGKALKTWKLPEDVRAKVGV